MANSPPTGEQDSAEVVSISAGKPVATGNRATPVDWDVIERDYRAGLLSVREIAASNGLSHTAIQKRAKSRGWDRDLSAKIQAKADALVARQAVAKSIAAATAAAERQIIEANAQRIAQVRGEHRADIARLRDLVLKLLMPLEAVEVWTLELIKEYAPTLKLLSEVYQRLVVLEREAYGIDKLMPEAPAQTLLVDDRELAKRIAFLFAKATATDAPIRRVG